MYKSQWKSKIKAACKSAGTYKESFNIVIDELSEILEQRDAIAEEYTKDPKPVIEYMNTAGATNVVKNPLLMMVNDLNKSAFPYWRDLGLTPAGLRKINEKTFKESSSKTSNSLIDRLKELQEARSKNNGRAERSGTSPEETE